jgi:hypothetical protein
LGRTDLGFSWRHRKGGEVEVLHHGRLASTLRGREASDFLAELEGADAEAQQQLMARLTGNYKRGNERTAARHPRNSGPDRDEPA